MSHRGRILIAASCLMTVCLLGSVPLLRAIREVRDAQPLGDVLYIPSAKAVKHLSLGYDGLMADLYWTRVVQYFGGKHHVKSKQYELLKPLLQITTTLDPHLTVAYEFGSVFLAQQPPEGAGDPQAAAELVKR